MSSNAGLEILPLAITMMAGPQILTAIVLLTNRRAIPAEFAFVVGVALAASIGVALMMLLASAFDLKGPSGEPSTASKVIEIVLVVLLALEAIRTYRTRATYKPPKFLGTMEEADWRHAFGFGFFLILFFPSDVLVMFTVGLHLEARGESWVDALPFIGLTTLIAALPILAYLLFRKRAEAAMPGVRTWLNTNSWIVTIICCGLFIFLILSG